MADALRQIDKRIKLPSDRVEWFASSFNSLAMYDQEIRVDGEPVWRLCWSGGPGAGFHYTIEWLTDPERIGV